MKIIRTIDALAVLGFFALMAVCVLRIDGPMTAIYADHPVWFLVLVLSGLIVGYLLADFVSGFVHFLGDTFGTVRTPIFGKMFIEPFRLHHTDQKGITRHGFIATNGHNCIVSLPALVLMAFAVSDSMLVSWTNIWLYQTLLWFILGIFATNQFHKWAHQDNPKPFIAWLQKRWIILSPERHRLHHTEPYASDYCITTGWLNPVLNKIRFFVISKAVLRRVPLFPKVDKDA